MTRTAWLTNALGEVQQFVVLEIQVGDLRAISNLLWQMFQLVMCDIQRQQTA